MEMKNTCINKEAVNMCIFYFIESYTGVLTKNLFHFPLSSSIEIHGVWRNLKDNEKDEIYYYSENFNDQRNRELVEA